MVIATVVGMGGFRNVKIVDDIIVIMAMEADMRFAISKKQIGD